MIMPVERRSVDLTDYPDLVMILPGFRLRGWRGLLALRRIGPGLSHIAHAPPDGLLAHEDMRSGLLHFGFRQYWSDMHALERFTRTDPHAAGGATCMRYQQAPASGTRPTMPTGASKRFTWRCRNA